MHLLMRQNVDGHAILEKFSEEPTEQELFDIMFQYYDEDVAKKVASNLVRLGFADVADSDCTQWELEKV